MNSWHSKPRFRPPEHGLIAVVLMAVLTLLLAMLLVFGSEETSRPAFAYQVFIITSAGLAASGALLSRKEFVAARQWLRARVAPQAGLERAQGHHLRQLLAIWAACAAPVLLLSSTLTQGLAGPTGLAILMAAMTAIAEWGHLQKPLLRRARAAWTARWHWLDRPNQSKFSSLGFLPAMFMLTGSPITGHSGLPQWGEPLDLRYLLRLAGFTFIALHLLQSPDLHWRRLLAPGARRRHIGTRILLASLKGNLAVTAFATGLALAVTATLGGIQWALLPAIAAGLLSDLLLATMLAVTLRGFAGSQTSSMLHLIALSVGIALISWVVNLHFVNPNWHRDGRHGLTMAAVMLLLLPLMQRVWLRADLVLLAAKAKAPPEPNGLDR